MVFSLVACVVSSRRRRVLANESSSFFIDSMCACATESTRLAARISSATEVARFAFVETSVSTAMERLSAIVVHERARA